MVEGEPDPPMDESGIRLWRGIGIGVVIAVAILFLLAVMEI
jgi:hypothetical protein